MFRPIQIRRNSECCRYLFQSTKHNQGVQVPQTINTPDDLSLQELCSHLLELNGTMEDDAAWPSRQIRLCGEYGVFEWFIGVEQGGQGWSDADTTRGYLAISEACLTTSFILTQLTGACRRIVDTENDPLRRRLLPGLLTGRHLATLGVSHLTTSRRHLGRPAMQARQTDKGFVLDGFSAWVTGAAQTDTVVIGAELPDGRQVLVALPTDRDGVSRPAAASLVALSASQTGPVRCDDVEITIDDLLAGPVEDVLLKGSGGGAGGLQTSTLALGLTRAALRYTAGEAERRPDLQVPVDALREEADSLVATLLAAAAGESGHDGPPTVQALRVRANSLVLRATQMSLAAAKGAGYASGHPVGRWCREALFFLVWSCPQPVVAEYLRELAGLADSVE
jgi:alkylation response protein AidB-like acyl-CoA dehydrogenase